VPTFFPKNWGAVTSCFAELASSVLDPVVESNRCVAEVDVADVIEDAELSLPVVVDVVGAAGTLPGLGGKDGGETRGSLCDVMGDPFAPPIFGKLGGGIFGGIPGLGGNPPGIVGGIIPGGGMPGIPGKGGIPGRPIPGGIPGILGGIPGI
jgi:hypothetical protein